MRSSPGFVLVTLGALLVAPRGLAAQATLEGIVFDSLRGAPLAGAVVQVDTTGRRATTSEDGWFRLTGLSPGAHQVTFQHLALDSLGIRSPRVSVTLKENDTTRVDLTLPSGATLLARLCPAPTPAQRGEGTSGLLGVVRDVETDAPLPGAVVRLQWRSVLIDPKLGLRRQVEFRDAVADSTGLYAVCNTPAGLEATLLAAAARRDTAGAQVFLPRNSAALLHLHLAPPRATGTLAGRVRDAAGGALASAEVTVVGRPGAAPPPVSSTDSRGGFTLRGIRAGTQVLEVKRVGFQPLRQTVTVVPSRSTTLALTLTAQPIQLAEVTARAPSTAELHGFLDRMKRGNGRFYTREEIADMRIVLSADLVRQFAGMKLENSSKGPVITNTSLRQNIKGNTCAIPTYLDGVPTPTDLVLNIPAEDIDGVEIYNIAENVPAEYSGQDGSCGAILVWTNWRAPKK